MKWFWKNPIVTPILGRHSSIDSHTEKYRSKIYSWLNKKKKKKKKKHPEIRSHLGS